MPGREGGLRPHVDGNGLMFQDPGRGDEDLRGLCVNGKKEGAKEEIVH